MLVLEALQLNVIRAWDTGGSSSLLHKVRSGSHDVEGLGVGFIHPSPCRRDQDLITNHLSCVAAWIPHKPHASYIVDW